MKNFKKINLLIITFLFIVMMPILAQAETKFNAPEYTEEYLKWLELSDEEKANCIEPKMYKSPEDDTNEVDKKSINLKGQLPANFERTNYGKVKDQGETNACWAYSASTVFSTNYNTIHGTNKQFSDLHMDYMTSKNYNSSTGFYRNADSGGNMEIALAYAMNGMGIALNSRGYKYPTKAYTDAKVSSYITLNTINDIKNYIHKYGVVSSQTYIDNYYWSYFSSSDVLNNKNLSYYCNNNYAYPNHAITLIGWDDNYVDNINFPGLKGAFKVLNSWGSEFGNNGTYYIFYDDIWVTYCLYGVMQTEDPDYDHLYQYDTHGYVGDIYSEGVYDIYGGNVFKKQSNLNEKLTELEIYFSDFGLATIYINPNSSDLNIYNAPIQINYQINEIGYHTIKFSDPIGINSNEFSVVVKYPGMNVPTELPSYYYGSWLYNVSSEYGESFVSTDGVYFNDLREYFDAANVCIKAFTKESEIENYVFDSIYYADNNPDLYLAYGYDYVSLANHWNNYGMAEGRKSSAILDLKYYVESNPDIKSAFGNNYVLAYNHFINNGFKELRASSPEYSGNYYRTNNSDLNNFGAIELIKHYMNYGRFECRKANNNFYILPYMFNSAVYAECNPDVVQAVGYNEDALKRHWYQYGIAEGRIASLIFDARNYLATNTDVANAYSSTNYAAAYQHFINYGFSEGRTGNAVFSVKHYLSKNTDVKNAYGNNYLLAVNHFVNYGKNELDRLTSPYFRVKTYKNKNSDLKQAYGDNTEMYYKHYLRFGQYENRVCK